ncbi:hypothetical protein [Thomasclavelia sp.]|uniref:hypothetical protein n=1 Tax=Thomasclavelia sp. TaxID=3025757 RepID=UPI0025E2D431|nr:hypothetical protein [Thomasclavelia sp.]
MIKKKNIKFFIKTGLKFCLVIMLIIGLIGCKSDEEGNEKMATVNLEYPGSDTLPERDIITFTDAKSEQIAAIASTDNDKRYVNIAPGEYIVTSNYLDTVRFEINSIREVWTVKANYKTKKFKITRIII